MKYLFFYIIKFYQSLSRHLFPRTCRFYPSCSQYTLEAVEKYGFSSGLFKAILRILRCSPFSRGGFDPVK